MDNNNLLLACLKGLLTYEDRFDLVSSDHALWICERLAWHKLLPLAAALSDPAKLRCPRLADIFQKTELRNLMKEACYRKQAHRVFNALHENGIAFMPFKGPFWIERLYESYHWRHIGDIDILVSRSDVPKTAARLLEMGFSAQILGRKIEDDLATRGELAFFPDKNAQGDVPVELHWDLMPSPRFLRKRFISNKDFWENTSPAVWQGLHFPVPTAEIRFLYYVLHAVCQHQFSRFVHIATLVHFVQKHPDLDWNDIYRTAVQKKAVTPLFYALKFMDCFWRVPDCIREIKAKCKPPLPARLTAAILAPESVIHFTQKKGTHRRKLFRAAMSW